MKRAKPNFSCADLKTDHQLSELIHKVGHEIGNPLTAIISLASVIERFEAQSPDPVKLAQYAGSIIKEAWRITSYNDRLVMLLTTKKTESPSCNLEHALEAVLERQNCTVDLHPPTDSINGAIDTPQFQLLVSELLQNAAGHASKENLPADRVDNSISLSSEDGMAKLCICNWSSRACEVELEKVFEPLVSSGRQCIGIGMTVVWAIVERFHGQLEVIEEEIDAVFRFTVEVKLPLSKEQLLVAKKPRGSLEAETSLLLVEDEDGVATAIEKILHATLGKETSLTCHRTSGPEAIDKIKSGEHFSAILCDLNLGRVNGRHIFETLVKFQPEACERFAFLTGERLRKDVQMYLASSGRPCLHKPFEVETLLKLVKDLVKS